MENTIAVYPDDYEHLFKDEKNVKMREAFFLLTASIKQVNEVVPENAGMFKENMHCVFDETNLEINAPFIMSQFLMQNLKDPSAFHQNEKLYWLQVAMEMGPDWITKLRKVVAFMDKVEGF